MRPIKLIVKTNSEKYAIIIGRNLISNLSHILKKNSISFKKYNQKSIRFVKFNKVNISSSKLRKI